MQPRFLPILLALCPLVFNQSTAFAYDDNAQQHILQIQQQLEQQFPQQIQANQPRLSNQGMMQSMPQGPSAQQQILQINQQLQQMTQGQHFQAPAQMAQPMQPARQMSQATGMPSQQYQSMPAQRTTGFAPNNSFHAPGSQDLNLPVLNSTISGYTSASDVIPNSVGPSAGVDILDESLKFHSQVNGQAASRPMQANVNQNFNVGAASNRNCNHATGSSGNNGSSCCQHSHISGNSGNGGDAAAIGGGQISTRAIGAIGAAALVGTFLSNGGVGGMIKSVGWDNSRHTRGMSIGGY